MAKHIVVLTIGTRGDVQPYVALGLELKARGHRVTIAAPENFAGFVEDHGLAHRPIGDDLRALLQDKRVTAFVEGSLSQKIRAYFGLMGWARAVLRDQLERSWHAAKDADLILMHPKTLFARQFEDAVSAPMVYSGFQPLTPSSEVPLLAIPVPNISRALNRLTYSMFHLESLFYGKIHRAFRKEVLGLGPRRRQHPLMKDGRLLTTLYGYSPHLLPPPSDWPAQIHVTGTWFLDDRTDWTPDAALAAFLDAGEPPVYIGFGSMLWHKERNTETIATGLRKWGGRALIGRGWGGMDPHDLPETVHVIDDAPHDKLLPLTAGVVHHGGAGTTASGLRAARPTFICPVLGDQPLYGARVHELGAGPPPVKLKQLTPDLLAERLADLVGNPAYRDGAGAIADTMAAENGTARAADIIDTLLREPGP